MLAIGPMVLVRKILDTNETIYYSCRAPNGECILVAESRKVDFEAKIELLQKRQADVMESANLIAKKKCHPETCTHWRDCLRINFLPQVDEDASFETDGLCALKFCCFVFGNLISAAELAKDFFITVPTAYRLTISLLTLVDRLVRLNVYAEITVENLLIDTVSSAVTLIDWSNSKMFDILPVQEKTELYRHAAMVVLELTGAKQDEEGKWSCLAGFEDDHMHSLFDMLHETAAIQLKVPDKLSEAIDYISELYGKQNLLIRDIVDSLHYIKFSPGRALFEVVEKMEE